MSRTTPSMTPEGITAKRVLFEKFDESAAAALADRRGDVADRERTVRALALWRMQQFCEQLCVPRDIPAKTERLAFLHSHPAVCGGHLPPMVFAILEETLRGNVPVGYVAPPPAH
jgi:hypothetical protein